MFINNYAAINSIATIILSVWSLVLPVAIIWGSHKVSKMSVEEAEKWGSEGGPIRLFTSGIVLASLGAANRVNGFLMRTTGKTKLNHKVTATAVSIFALAVIGVITLITLVVEVSASLNPISCVLLCAAAFVAGCASAIDREHLD